MFGVKSLQGFLPAAQFPDTALCCGLDLALNGDDSDAADVVDRHNYVLIVNTVM